MIYTDIFLLKADVKREFKTDICNSSNIDLDCPSTLIQSDLDTHIESGLW